MDRPRENWFLFLLCSLSRSSSTQSSRISSRCSLNISCDRLCRLRCCSCCALGNNCRIQINQYCSYRIPPGHVLV
ncbi:hypothetical protein V1520DRAFT_154585 [Lipomyces starkeyi]|uniref:Secreted protein n=1 Tax=Lipomyces starkeyi NRRL Y-11557 TaxID=675824 RepID=A0A1E3QGK6_LIPST|nr:hypothetical protein LIPSTDRAFT_144358 [Lipomyces starkeyi NRRL Y-11557]